MSSTTPRAAAGTLPYGAPALFIGAAEGTMKVMAPLDDHALDPAPAIP